MVSSATPTLMSSVVPANGMVVMFQTDSRIEGVSATAARNKLPGSVILFRIRAR